MKVFSKISDIFNILSEAVSEGIIVVNEKQVIVGTNNSTDEMFGYRNNELPGQSLGVLIPQKFQPGHSGHFKSFLKDKKKRKMGKGLDMFGARKDGQEFPLEVGLNPFEIYGNTYVMALIVDITERKNYTENLERTVEERTTQLQNALNKEKELSALKTRFLSLVSHEFKTPLSAISTSTALLRKYTKMDDREKTDKHLNTIQSMVKHLDQILEDFLSVERLDSGKVNYKFTRFPFDKLVNEVLYDANTYLKAGQRIDFTNDVDNIMVEQDRKIMELVLSNLVHNAVKYSPENTTIKIDAKTEGDELTLKIADQGIGIPKKDQKFIFDRYFRASNVLMNQGTGIGLNIARKHLENLGGRIGFTSVENEGTTFVVELPIAKNL
ncbi:MAG: PAS domain S-box protein [Maribacter sp.]|nr:PAS domain S-box protein [Maribacter sp.]